MVVRFYFRLLSQNVLEVSKEFREARTQLTLLLFSRERGIPLGRLGGGGSSAKA